MTSELVALGLADADDAWLGIRRHQAVLALVGVALMGDAILNHRPIAELTVGLVTLIGAAPISDGRTIAQTALVLLRFCARRHWLELSIREFGDDIVLWGERDASFRGYRLRHLGRLDLSGRDIELAASLTALVDTASASRGTRHLSVHIHHGEAAAQTLLTLPADVSAPDGWLLDNALARDVVGRDEGATRSFERFTYLRTARGATRVYRVRDFSAVPAGRALLEQLSRARPAPDISLHVDVVSGTKGSRVAARAVHKLDSDDVTARAAGFRRSARAARSIERLAQREVLVAGGRSLVRVGVFVIVRASSLQALRAESAAIWRHAHDAGLRLESGRGMQANWFQAQLPGGVNW